MLPLQAVHKKAWQLLDITLFEVLDYLNTSNKQ